MARPLRIEYKNAWYHVMNRGSGRRCIFPNDRLREKFLNLLSDLHEMYAVCCHAYCLMGNHYHLLVQTRRANLGRAMRHLDGVYAQTHNRYVGTDGPLFRGRYTGQIIERNTYLLQVSRYVHRNPLVAGLCDQLVAYQWSSYPYFAGLRPVPSWLHLHETISTFESVRSYCEFVGQPENEDDSEEVTNRLDPEHGPPVLGSPSFVEAIYQRFCETPDYEIPQAKVPLGSITLNEIIDVVSVQTATPRPALITPHNRRTREVRALAMVLCRQCAGFSLRDIANAFGIDRYTTAASTISRYRDKAAHNTDLARELTTMKAAIAKMRNA